MACNRSTYAVLDVAPRSLRLVSDVLLSGAEYLRLRAKKSDEEDILIRNRYLPEEALWLEAFTDDPFGEDWATGEFHP